jgi:hypothetical protein
MRLSILLIVPLFLMGCNHKESIEKKAAREQLELRTAQQAKVSEMISKYNADDRWIRVLNIRDSLNIPIATLNMQQAFPESSVQPSVFYVGLDDVIEQNGQYFATFTASILANSIQLSQYFHYGESSISFPYDILMILELQCTQKQAQELLNSDLSFLSSLAIVAKIREVRKVKLSYQAKDGSDEEVYIKSQPSKVFYLTGELADFCMVKWW